MKKCAVCGSNMAFVEADLCGNCFTKYGPDYPEWVKELISIEKHNYYVENEEDRFLREKVIIHSEEAE